MKAGDLVLIILMGVLLVGREEKGGRHSTGCPRWQLTQSRRYTSTCGTKDCWNILCMEWMPNPTNIASVHLVVGCPNAGVKIVRKKKKPLRATQGSPDFCPHH